MSSNNNAACAITLNEESIEYFNITDFDLLGKNLYFPQNRTKNHGYYVRVSTDDEEEFNKLCQDLNFDPMTGKIGR
jgi:hypothetical protein